MIALNSIELRVLAVLIEKSLTQAGGYPMTLNGITLGANQKQNREPVVEYGEGEVSNALRTLQHKGLVAQAPTSMGARSVRFEHKAVDKFHWDRREQAIMAELMLRGRQTAGELRTHGSRMVSLPDLPAVTNILEGLKTAATPFVEELPREPGRSANRFRHLLGEQSAAAREEPRPAAAVPAPAHSAAAADGGATAGLAERVERLATEVAELRALVERLRDRISSNEAPQESTERAVM